MCLKRNKDNPKRKSFIQIEFLMIKKIYFLTFIFLFATSLFSNSLDDLTEGEEPLYGSKKRERYRSTAIFWEIEDWQDHYSETILFLYNYTNYPKYRSKRFFPFYYNIESKIDTRKYSRFLNYTVFEEKQEIDKTFFPFFYWGEDESKLKTYFTFFPLFYSMNQDLNTHKKKEFLTPLSYQFNEEKSDKEGNLSISSELILPVYRKFYSKDNTSEITSYSIPLIPILYYRKQNETQFFSFAWIFGTESKNSNLVKNYLFPFWYYSTNPEKRESFFISPIYYKDKTQYYEYKSYLYMLYTWEHGSRGWNFLGLAGSSLDENNRKKNYLFPFWYYKENEIFLSLPYSQIQYPNEKIQFGPFYYFSNSEQTKISWLFNYYKEQSEDYSYIHLFPFFELESKPLEKKMSFFYIFRNSSTKESSKWNFFPVYFYEKNRDGVWHSLLFGLYGWSYNTRNELNNIKFLPFYYYQKDKTLFTPIYMRFGKENAKEGKIFSPVYNRVWDEEGEFKNFLLYFSLSSNHSKNYFKTIAPVWWDWKLESTEGNIFFPFYGTYKNGLGEEFRLNILGIAQSNRTGILRPDINVGRKSDRFYLDTDISWFYSLFRVSTRISAPNPFLQANEETLQERASLEEVPSLSKRKSFTRENTNFFYGYSALFSAIAYEKGDSKRHFRVFPFMWFTWNEENEDKLILFPPILPIAFYYNTPELRYLVFIPFYGEQITPESQIRATLLTAYIQEEYKEKNWKETSVLCPIFNFYNSSEESGFRIFPFFWKKLTNSNNTTYSRNFSLLHYYSFNEDKSSNKQETKFFSWVFYFNREQTKDTQINKYFFPIYYRSEYVLKNLEQNRYERKTLSWSLLHYQSDEKTQFGTSTLGEEFFFSPIYISSNVYEKQGSSSWTLYPLFLFYTENSNKENYYNFALLFNLKKTEKSTQVGAGLIVNFIGLEHTNEKKFIDSKFWFFPILYRFKEELKTEGEISYSVSSLNYFFPFIFYSERDVYSKESLTGSESSLLTLLYFQQTKKIGTESESQTRFYTIPFLYTNSEKNSFSWRLWLFVSYRKDLSTQNLEFSIWPIYPIFYYDSVENHVNILGILFDKKNIGSYNRFYLFPVWFSSSSYSYQNPENQITYNTETSVFHIIPFYFSETYKAKDISLREEFNFFSLGLFYQRKPEKVYWNYLYLLDYESLSDSQTTKLGGLFHSIYFENSPSYFQSSVFYDLLWRSETRTNFTKYIFLFTKYQKQKDFLSMNFFPLFSYESSPNFLDMFFYPTFSSYEKNETSETLYHLAGILYWSRTNTSLKERKHFSLVNLLHSYHEYSNPNGLVKEFTLLPLGILYSYKEKGTIEKALEESIGWGSVWIRQRKIENDYHRYGSLWGLLWQYEYESETDYQKFSILKLLSYEVYKGRTRILGIPID